MTAAPTRALDRVSKFLVPEKHGAKGYELKAVNAIELILSILAVHRGESAFDSRSATMVVRSLHGNGNTRRLERLTDREQQVLQLRDHRQVPREQTDAQAGGVPARGGGVRRQQAWPDLTLDRRVRHQFGSS